MSRKVEKDFLLNIMALTLDSYSEVVAVDFDISLTENGMRRFLHPV